MDDQTEQVLGDANLLAILGMKWSGLPSTVLERAPFFARHDHDAPEAMALVCAASVKFQPASTNFKPTSASLATSSGLCKGYVRIRSGSVLLYCCLPNWLCAGHSIGQTQYWPKSMGRKLISVEESLIP